MKHWIWRAYFGVLVVLTAVTTIAFALSEAASLEVIHLVRVFVWLSGLLGLYAYCYDKQIGRREIWLGVLVMLMVFLLLSFLPSQASEPLLKIASEVLFAGVLFGPLLYALYDYSNSFRERKTT